MIIFNTEYRILLIIWKEKNNQRGKNVIRLDVIKVQTPKNIDLHLLLQ